MTKDITTIFSDIDTFLYKYNKKAQEDYAQDDKDHIGVMAQELQENPLTKDCVETNADGKLFVNTDRLTLTLAGVLAQLCKKVEELEKVVSR